MGFWSYFSRPKLGIAEAGIGLVSRGSSFSENNIDSEPQNVSMQQQYDNAYNNFPIVSSAVDTQAEQAVQDFYFEGPNSDKLTKWSEKVNLPIKFVVAAKHMLKNGNIWSEHPSRNEMKMINPTTMTVWRKTTGDIIGHSQEIEFQKRVLWGTTGDKSKDAEFKKKAPIKNIVHFAFNKLASEKYGKSIIHSSLPLLDTKDQIEGDLKILVRRYAAPIIHAKVGDEQHLPKDSDISNIQNKLKDIYADTEYVTNYLTELKVIGFEGKALNIDYILKHVDANIMKGLMTFEGPPGAEKDAKGGNEVDLRKSGRHIKALQRDLKTEFEDNIIRRMGLGGENDHIIWGDAEEREHEIEIDILRGLVTDGIVTPQKANSLLPPEFRETLPDPIDMMQQEQNIRSQGQDQSPFQKGSDKIKDKPTDPTLKQKEPGMRRNKTDRQIPVLTNGRS